jgi:hypothetical protein
MENPNSLDGFYPKASLPRNLVKRDLCLAHNANQTYSKEVVQAVRLHNFLDSLIHDH